MAGDKLKAALERIDAANADDPNTDTVDGQEHPRELLYSERMTRWLERLSPGASEALQIAARAQHICRRTIPRSDFDMDRRGYHLWRTKLGKFHAEKTAGILREVGYEAEFIERVESLIRKEGLKKNPETQMLEDVICLVFLEGYFADFSKKHDEEKIIGIVQKTWKKMSSRGHEAALALEFSDEARRLIEKSLA